MSLRSNIRFLSVPILMILGCGSGLLPRSSQSRGTTLTAPSLGTAAAFSVLGGQTVTNAGPTTMSGNLGVSPGTAITGFPPGLVTGSTHAADTVAGQAQSDVTTSYDALAGLPCTANLTGQDLGGMTLTPGVYCFSSEAILTGTLVLDAKLEANAAFVFQIVSKLTTASGASIRLINGASPCDIYWQVGSSATIGTGTSFSGNILALTSIALQTGASLTGRALARNGAVTLDNNLIRSNTCTAAEGGGGSDGGVATLSCCFGAVECNGACVDLKTNANDCGACGKHCARDQVCSAGACTACSANSAQCTDQCADLQSDPFNCGGCGKVCAASQSCTAGVCGACEATVCANTCVQTNNDRANCGACGNACAADQCCNAGVCGTTGPLGFCKLR